MSRFPHPHVWGPNSDDFRSAFNEAIDDVEAGALVASDEDVATMARFFEITTGNLTYLAVLCGMLVAHIANDELHPGALQVKWDPIDNQPEGRILKSFNGRSVSEHIVGEAIRRRVSLGRMAREPAQNKPFSQIESVYHALRADGETDLPERSQLLVELIEQVAQGGRDRARDLLAAYIPLARVHYEDQNRHVELPDLRVEMFELVEVTQRFVETHSEDGKVGQAFVAACLDFVGAARVDMGSPVYASRKRVGDVGLRDENDILTRPYEVRQKGLQQGNLEVWAVNCAQEHLRIGTYVDLTPGTDGASLEQQLVDIAKRHGVNIRYLRGTGQMIESVMDSPTFSVERFTEVFPVTFLERLTEIGASTRTREEWASIFAISR